MSDVYTSWDVYDPQTKRKIGIEHLPSYLDEDAAKLWLVQTGDYDRDVILVKSTFGVDDDESGTD